MLQMHGLEALKTPLLFIGQRWIIPQLLLCFGLANLALSQTLSPQEIQSLKSEIAKDSKGAIDKRLSLARHFSEAKDYDKVIDSLRPVVDHLDVSGMRMLAKAFTEKKENLQAVRVLENLILQVKTDYVSFTRLAEAYVAIKQEETAVINFQKAIAINKRYRPAYDGLLTALDKAGKRYEYRVTLLDMISIFGESGDLMNLTCKAYYEDGFLDDARQVCQKAISKSPQTADNHIYYGLTLQAIDNSPRAVAIIQQAAKNYQNSEFAQYMAGKLHEENKNMVAAYKFYRQGTVADDKAGRSWLGLGRMAFESKNYEEALKAFRMACKLDRSTAVQDFRNAATKLSLENNYTWKGKFSSAAMKCRYQSE